MPTYVTRQGDSLWMIAAKHGLRDWMGLYEHPDNAPLRAACPDPNLLMAGTPVVIPTRPNAKQSDHRTGENHTFVVSRSTCMLRLHLQAPDGAPLAGWRYRLVGGGQTHQGDVPDSGDLSIELAQPVATAMFATWPADAEPPESQDEIELEIGGLEPLGAPRGIQARLANLGHYQEAIDGDVGSAATEAAWRSFGHGDADQLRKEYGC